MQHSALITQLAESLAERPGFVYFIRDPLSGAIKIGWSRRPMERLAELERELGRELTLLRTVPGTRTLECDLHRRFRHLRLSGEWFMGDPSLRAVASPSPPVRLRRSRRTAAARVLFEAPRVAPFRYRP